MKNPLLHNTGVFIGRSVKNIRAGFRSGSSKTQAVDGIGHGITKGDRTRKVHAFLSGVFASADRHQTKYTLEKLRETCRMYDRQSSLFSGILDRGCDNIIGSNFSFIPDTGDSELNKTAKEYIKGRMKKEVCDAAGVMDFTQILKTTVREIWVGGDTLLVKRSNGSAQAVEGDQIVSPQTKAAGKRIVLGVELNDVNRPVAFYVKGRKSKGDFGSIQPTADSSRVPAANAIFTAYRKRFGQTRGVPFLAAILASFDRTNNYIDYESLAAEINSMLAWALTKKESGEGAIPGVDDNDETESSFEKVQKLEAGMILELLEGEDLKMIGAERPGDNFTPFTTTMLRIIGVGIGYPLELLLLDFSNTNFSAARASLGEGRRMFRGWQKFIGDSVAMPWYSWQIARGIASGELPARAELFNARPQWPAWEYINPLLSAKGNDIAIKSHTKTISQCIREIGGDPDEVFAEMAEDMQKLAELGIVDTETTDPKQAENIARAIKVGIPITQQEARIAMGFAAELGEGDPLRFNDQDVLQYHIESGLLTINEARKVLALPPVPWGNVPVRKTGVSPVDVDGGDDEAPDESVEDVEDEPETEEESEQ